MAAAGVRQRGPAPSRGHRSHGEDQVPPGRQPLADSLGCFEHTRPPNNPERQVDEGLERLSACPTAPGEVSRRHKVGSRPISFQCGCFSARASALAQRYFPTRACKTKTPAYSPLSPHPAYLPDKMEFFSWSPNRSMWARSLLRRLRSPTDSSALQGSSAPGLKDTALRIRLAGAGRRLLDWCPWTEQEHPSAFLLRQTFADFRNRMGMISS